MQDACVRLVILIQHKIPLYKELLILVRIKHEKHDYIQKASREHSLYSVERSSMSSQRLGTMSLVHIGSLSWLMRISECLPFPVDLLSAVTVHVISDAAGANIDVVPLFPQLVK